MIKRFAQIEGIAVEKIEGQKKFAFSLSDHTDFFDLQEWNEHGFYPGSVLCFYDLETGEVFTPFEKERNVVFSKPKYIKGGYYFLRGSCDDKKIDLVEFIPHEEAKLITSLNMDEVELYNLSIMGEELHIVSSNETFNCYYPKKFSVKLKPNESAMLIEDGKIYSTEWIEEGWDYLSDKATENYKCYDKLIIRDLDGNILSEETGTLFHNDDGTWWIA